MNRRSRLAPGVLVAMLAVTACGSRADDTLRQQAAQAALSQGGGPGGTTGVGDGSTGPGTTGGATTGATGGGTTTGGTTTGGTTTGGTTGGGAATGGTGGSGGFSGNNGGATDVGVTATAINLGIIADLSGPIPGLFKGAVNGTQAYIAKVNAEGGVFGRQLKLDVGDSQLSCNEYKARTQAAVAKDFALVGSFALYDSCGADVLKANPKVSDVHSALSTVAQGVPNNFSVAPLGSGWRTGPLQYYKTKFGDAWQHIGTIYAGVGGGADTWKAAQKVIERPGAPWQGNVDVADPYQPTDTDFTAQVIKMQQAGVKMIYAIAIDNAGASNLLRAVRGQAGSRNWPVVFGGPAYDKAFLERAKSDLTASGVGPTFQDQQYALFFNSEDAAAIPAVKDFQTWYGRVTGGGNPDLFAAYGWSSAQLFVQALKAAGPKATRASLQAELKKITSFDAGGLLVKANPAQNKPGTCWVFMQAQGAKWVRQDSPANSFRCDGTYETAS